MKSQQIAVYASLNDFMVAVGYQNAGDRREDDPVWSTLNQNNYTAMMEYKFGVDTRFASVVPTNLEAVHEGITGHEAWSYREELEHDDGEEAPEIVYLDAAPEGGETEPEGSGEVDGGGESAPEGSPLSTEPPADGGQTQQPETPAADQQPSQEQQTEGTEPPADEQPKEPEAPAEEPKDEQPKEPAAEEGGDSTQE